MITRHARTGRCQFLVAHPDKPGDAAGAFPFRLVPEAIAVAGNTWGRPLFSRGGSTTATCTMARDWVVVTRQATP